MPSTKPKKLSGRLDPSVLPGTHHTRVFIGGSYVQTQTPVLRYFADVVWYTGQVKKAPAREILAGIQKSAQASGELRSMSAKQYARGLVEDAAYFVPRVLLAYFQQQEYPTEFDRALEYLAAMPTSGV